MLILHQVFHRILDLKRGWISIRSFFYYPGKGSYHYIEVLPSYLLFRSLFLIFCPYFFIVLCIQYFPIMKMKKLVKKSGYASKKSIKIPDPDFV